MDSANIKKGIGLLLVFLVLPLGLAVADQKDFLFQQGNEFYKAGDYEKAARAYEQILQMGYESAAIYYNLGNAYFKLHQNSRAILNYERALR
ncbi:MAG TPA: tetratricopeptide repeat protein, partial [Bacteroidetes bacterium]|nr:tetratricopeptide repeat protein [Bacteroidota bacterium]